MLVCEDDADHALRDPAPRYHPACRAPRRLATPGGLATRPAVTGHSRSVLLRPACAGPFFRRLTGDGRVDACEPIVASCAHASTEGLDVSGDQLLDRRGPAAVAGGEGVVTGDAKGGGGGSEHRGS